MRGILLYVRDFLLSVPYFLFSVRSFQALSVRAFCGLGRGVFVFCALLFIFCALFGTPLFTGVVICWSLVVILGFGSHVSLFRIQTSRWILDPLSVTLVTRCLLQGNL